jgi:thiamine pyrophosphokinase
MIRRALLICNGRPPSRSLTHRLARQADLIVAADGGANVAREYRIPPDVIIGDMDSIKPSTTRAFSSSLRIQVTRQDNTDLEKALDFMMLRGVEEVVIIGATGRRLDFTLGNLSVIWHYADRLRVRFVDDTLVAAPIVRPARTFAPAGTTVSLIPFGGCSGITLRNLKYTLTNATMRVGDIGVSNIVVRSPFTVSVKRGRLLLIVFDPDAKLHFSR